MSVGRTSRFCIADFNSRRLELARARSAHTAILDEIKEAEKKLETTQESLEKDWGRDWEWKKLEGTCIEQDLGE